MKEDEVLKKETRDVKDNKKKEKQPSNTKRKTASTSTATKKVVSSKESTSKTVAKKKKTDSKTTETEKKKAGSSSSSTKAKSATSKKVAVKKVDDTLDDLFENSIKQVTQKAKKSTSAGSGAKASDASKKSSTATKKTASTTRNTTKNTTKTTQKSGAAKKISEQVGASEKSSKIKINKKEKSVDIGKEDKEDVVRNNKIEKKEPAKTTKTKKPVERKINEENEDKKKDEEKDEIDFSIIDEELQKKNSIPNDDFFKLLKDSALSIIYFIGVLAFLVFDLIAFGKIPNSTFIVVQNVFSFVLLGAAISFFEIAYRKEDSSRGIIGIEALCIGIYTLTIPYICQIFKGTFTNFLLSALVVVVGYYFIKACIIFYRKQNRYLRLQENFTVEESDNEFNIDDDEDE